MNKPFKINSVNLPLMGDNYLKDNYDSDGMSKFIDRIFASGADSVRLTVTPVLRTPFSNEYDPELNTIYAPSREDIIQFCNVLKQNGIGIEIQPLVLIHDKKDASNLITDRIAPSDPKLWMNNHSAEIIKWAKLAEEIGADRFTVFTDLDQHMTWNPILKEDWVKLTHDIKKIYTGHITSTAWTNGQNFGNFNSIIECTPIEIWKSLDSIGIGFFPEPITNKNNPTLDELTSGWYKNGVGISPIEFLKGLNEKYEKPIYISDRTFRSFDGTNVDEGQIFQSNINLEPDYQEQADLFESFLRVFSLEQGDWLLGVAFNSITRGPQQALNSVSRYLKSPVGEDWEGKPAGDVLSAWFNGKKQSNGKYFIGDKDSITIELSSTINSDATTPKVSVYINNDLFLENVSIDSRAGQKSQSYTFDTSKYDQITELRLVITNTTYIDQSKFSNVIIKRISVNLEDLPLINGEFSNGASTNGFTYSNAGTVLYRASAFDQIKSLQTKSDHLIGGYHHDTLEGGLGDDYLDGGAGFDVAVYEGKNSEYSVTNAFVKDLISQRDGTDAISNIERLRFSDKVVALDIDGNAGQAYRLYQAALDRTPDQRGLADWINYMDNGGQLNAMAQMFIDSQEFRTKYGALDNFNFVNQLYLNVLDRNGEATGVNAWVGALNGGALSRSQVLVGFSESGENQANVIGQIKDGIPYVEYWLS